MDAFPLDLPGVRTRFAVLQQRLATAGAALRSPPPVPTTCCGRGCNGCVWEGFYAAAAWWCEDAQQTLAQPAGINQMTASNPP